MCAQRNRSLSPFISCHVPMEVNSRFNIVFKSSWIFLILNLLFQLFLFSICVLDRDMGARHRARAHAIQIMKVQVIAANKCRRAAIKQFHVSVPPSHVPLLKGSFFNKEVKLPVQIEPVHGRQSAGLSLDWCYCQFSFNTCDKTSARYLFQIKCTVFKSGGFLKTGDIQL